MVDLLNLGLGGRDLDGTFDGVVATRRGCLLPGTADNYLSIPADVSQDVTGDIEIVLRCAIPVWATGSVNMVPLSKTRGAWDLVFFAGAVTFAVNGVNACTATNIDLGVVDGLGYWFKFVRVAATGACQISIAGDQELEPVHWVEVNTTGAQAPGNIAVNTDPVGIGARPGVPFEYPFAGHVHDVIVRDGIDGPAVVHVAATDYPHDIGSTSFPATVGPDVDVSRGAVGTVTVVTATGAVTNPDQAVVTASVKIPQSTKIDIAATDDAVIVFAGVLGPLPTLDAFLVDPRLQTNGQRMSLQNRVAGVVRCRPDDGPNAVIASVAPTSARNQFVTAIGVIDRTAATCTVDIYDATGANVGTNTVDIGAVGAISPDAGLEFLNLSPASMTAVLFNVGPDVAQGLDKAALSLYLLTNNADPVIGDELAGWVGVWMPGVARLPGLPPLGCEVADGYGVAVEIFYNPDTTSRRFGVGTFGSDQFGQFTDVAPGVERWVDVTRSVFGSQVFRGQADPTIDQPTDELRFSILDIDGEVFGWLPPGQLGSPNINAPARISVIDRDGSPTAVTYVRLNRFAEIHGADSRTVEVVGFGVKTDLLVGLIHPQRPKETSAVRIDFVLDAIGFVDAVAPYPDDFSTRNLAADTHDRSVSESSGYQMIQEAANSANYYVHTDPAGSLVWREIANTDPPSPPIWVISDCSDTGENVVATTITYAADTTEVLNRVQLINAMKPAENVEALDPVSIAKWGQRSRGFGFPLRVVNEQQTDAQAIADAFLTLSANVVNRVRSVEFDTLADPRWWPFLLSLDISLDAIVRRTSPNGVEDFNARVIGVNIRFGPAGISGVLFMSTTTQTF